MSIKITTAQYISKADKLHNGRYSYTKTNYSKAHDFVTITCAVHGDFEMRAYCHTGGKQNCPKCCHNYPMSGQQLVAISKRRYGDQYQIDLATFRGTKYPMALSCKYHGSFIISEASVHLRGVDGGCQDCAMIKRMEALKTGNSSKAESQWLDSLGIAERQYRIEIENKTFVVDGFDPSTSTVYEFYGSFWHGNPSIYNQSDNHPVLNTTFGQLYNRTIIRENLIKSKFNLVTHWS